MLETFTLPDFPPFDVNDPEMVFGADATRFYGGRGWTEGKLAAGPICAALRAETDIFSTLFFSGGKLSDFGREWRPDIDSRQAMRALKALMGSFAVPHEQKEATVALAIHHWTQPTASGTEARQRQDREDGPDPKGNGPVPNGETPR